MEELPRRADLPMGLTDREQWVCWREQERDGRQTKVPVDPNTDGFVSATDPETWGTFDETRAYAGANGIGVGFVFTEADPFVGVDLDKCRVPATGTVAEWAKDIVERFDSYTEVSPSGTGYHVIVEGAFPTVATDVATSRCTPTRVTSTSGSPSGSRTPTAASSRWRPRRRGAARNSDSRAWAPEAIGRG
jgi:hypothetical protein